MTTSTHMLESSSSSTDITKPSQSSNVARRAVATASVAEDASASHAICSNIMLFLRPSCSFIFCVFLILPFLEKRRHSGSYDDVDSYARVVLFVNRHHQAFSIIQRCSTSSSHFKCCRSCKRVTCNSRYVVASFDALVAHDKMASFLPFIHQKRRNSRSVEDFDSHDRADLIVFHCKADLIVYRHTRVVFIVRRRTRTCF